MKHVEFFFNLMLLIKHVGKKNMYGHGTNCHTVLQHTEKKSLARLLVLAILFYFYTV